MKRCVALCFMLICLWITKSVAGEIDSVTYKKFGLITVYHPTGTPTSVALFVSGDGGWKNGVINMAKNIANQGALVLGIDGKRYGNYLSKESAQCLYPAADFEELSLFIQKKYKLTNYHKPVLLGYSYGAVLIYGILAQAPANTFKGAIALGFCPDINIKKPMCKGAGLTQHVLKPGVSYYLEATKSLTAPFIVLNGVKDQTCPFDATAAFLKGMPMTELVTLTKVGHGFSIANNWLPDFNTAYKKVLAAPSFNEQKSAYDFFKTSQPKAYSGGMPLTLVPSGKKNNLPLVFMISGDGGWTSFDQSLAESMASKGLSVIGLDAQKYFWNVKTPEGVTADLSKAIAYYKQEFGKENFVLAGYSFGASVVPFLASRLSAELKGDLKAVFSLSPDVTADFEIHIADMLSIGSSNDKYDVIAEMKKIKSLKPLCVFGTEEDADVKDKFVRNGIKVTSIPGTHHFNDDYSAISSVLLKELAE
ncbi:AcvB/VirJ family lysyl-phosphatidylglycerol hydrolase [Pedobacter panaciterrae]|uniref:AcvB/VirJ family lysyl-phosphatidylglycerol hydrolase n=1 Tax=Pedobacter panaciterrae TaxID=363849 RepID=A0ABU8NHW1_9SPHI|nr:AcvB/VirJ family lysyl-phosphatidylglycerol hydrolase [uncultured Pedobacter sp.]